MFEISAYFGEYFTYLLGFGRGVFSFSRFGEMFFLEEMSDLGEACQKLTLPGLWVGGERRAQLEACGL
jgi:hypothetical protein